MHPEICAYFKVAQNNQKCCFSNIVYYDSLLVCVYDVSFVCVCVCVCVCARTYVHVHVSTTIYIYMCKSDIYIVSHEIL